MAPPSGFVVAPSPRRPRVPRPLAQRIDRLAVRAHLFHRWAHHPLCDRYAGEVVRIGRRARICRGCALSAAGVIGGGGLGGLGAPAPWLALAIAAGATALLVPTLLVRLRPPKLVTRLVPTAFWSLSLAAALRGASIACALGTLALVSGCALLYRRRGPDRGPCATCPEREHQPCSGLAPIVLRERAFQRLSARWLRAGM